MVVPVLPREGALGALLAHHVKPVGREPPSPLIVGEREPLAEGDASPVTLLTDWPALLGPR